ncbi:unknown [Candidatus Colimorpha enterica]|uniref:Uncharacterized protein n=1 Tax=Candidatus Colimorpha enterica TaxID=3083063 RepID=R6U0B5_9BACT|nr:unknown [Candidatus Colimorpha enterica]
MTDIPVTARVIAIAIASAIATERLRLIAFPGMRPALTDSICASSTPTAGSAEIMNQPSRAASGISRNSIPDLTIA